MLPWKLDDHLGDYCKPPQMIEELVIFLFLMFHFQRVYPSSFQKIRERRAQVQTSLIGIYLVYWKVAMDLLRKTWPRFPVSQPRLFLIHRLGDFFKNTCPFFVFFAK